MQTHNSHIIRIIFFYTCIYLSGVESLFENRFLISSSYSSSFIFLSIKEWSSQDVYLYVYTRDYGRTSWVQTRERKREKTTTTVQYMCFCISNKNLLLLLCSHSRRHTLAHTVRLFSFQKRNKEKSTHNTWMFVEVYSIFVFNVDSSISSFFMSVVGKCVLWWR